MELDKCAVSLAARADSLAGSLLGYGTAKLMRGYCIDFPRSQCGLCTLSQGQGGRFRQGMRRLVSLRPQRRAKSLESRPTPN